MLLWSIKISTRRGALLRVLLTKYTMTNWAVTFCSVLEIRIPHQHIKFAVWNWNYASENISFGVVMDQNNLSESVVIINIPDEKANNVREKSNKCTLCDYASSYSSHLRTHLRTHSGEKPNKCNQCDYASSHAGNLRTHLKTHSGEKSNKCNQCDYASSRAGDLRRHLKTHSGEKSNRCNQCSYACSQAGHLRKHLETHSGEK